jgi:ribosomal protein S18 acetylase RimI-like enzyme
MEFMNQDDGMSGSDIDDGRLNDIATTAAGNCSGLATLVKKKKNKKNKKNKQKKDVLVSSTLHIDEQDSMRVLNSPQVIDSWFENYQEAFKEENAFIDRVNGSSSSSSSAQSSQALKIDGNIMMHLVFLVSSKDANRFRRVCFFARDMVSINAEMHTEDMKSPVSASMEKDISVREAPGGDVNNTAAENTKNINKESLFSIVGYATVDEDIEQPNGVCHIRMILVHPNQQRRGVGRKLLQHIVDRFSTRHLGLKYANCHNYKYFYSSVGFSVIGADEAYTYMAIRR